MTGRAGPDRRLPDMAPLHPDPPGGATVVLPPLTTAEVRLLHAAVQLFRSLARHASAYDDAHSGLRTRIAATSGPGGAA